MLEKEEEEKSAREKSVISNTRRESEKSVAVCLIFVFAMIYAAYLTIYSILYHT